jgi:hypothetical protein
MKPCQNLPALTVFYCLTLCVMLLVSQHPAGADESADTQWKLTAGRYMYREYSGIDINLRWRRGDTDIWGGFYRDRNFGSQWRTGWDSVHPLFANVQLQPSLQLATRGFIGGSANLQVGDAWFAFAGLGRTNLKSYFNFNFNLNFDPNDAATYGIGHRADAGQLYALFVVADNRLGTHQQDWHLTATIPISTQRWSIDVLYKQGNTDIGAITAWGGSVTWDFPHWFVRLARDRYQNFSTDDAWRVATGYRFP